MTVRSSNHRPCAHVRHSLGAAIFLALLALPARDLLGADTSGSPDEPCCLCREDLEYPLVRLTASQVDSITAGQAAFNEKRLARIDSLLHAGTWGPSEGEHAQRSAHLLARLSLSTAYHALAYWALASDRVYEVDQAALAAIAERYSDGCLFVGPRLAGLRIGRGRACVRYVLSDPGEGESWHGGRRMRWKVRSARIQGRERRVLDVTIPTAQDGKVRFLFSSHYTMAISHERSSGPPAPFEWFLVHDIEGAWVRKWGTHRPSAFMLWRSSPSLTGRAPLKDATFTPVAPAAYPSSGMRDDLSLPETPLLGVCIYVPDLKLRLPLLPDIHVADLREVDIITPVFDLGFFDRGDQPGWLDVSAGLGFDDWRGLGPIPPEIRERFPDQ